MPIARSQGANLPRWRYQGKNYHADRIQHHENGVLMLESGTHVHATDELLKSGPARMGDFWLCETDADGQPSGAERLLSGAAFQSDATPIAHALDISQVSADEQPGRTADQPTSGDVDDPAAKTAREAHGMSDPVADGMEARAEKDRAKKEREAAEEAEKQKKFEESKGS